MPSLRLATFADVDRLQPLIQRCYRGDASRAGWTHEADLLEGERISAADLAAQLAAPGERMLVLEEEGEPVGCVRVADLGDGLAYLGMLAVEPARQAAGLGRALIDAAEALARETFGATRIEMTVIDTRHELIAWYERRGYRTAEPRPFPVTDTPLMMVAMVKPL